jgi:hypothetical protein
MKNKNLNENDKKAKDLSPKYTTANYKFKKMMANIPDFSKMEPIEIYNWVEKLAKLTNI